MYDRILVATDGSETAGDAATHAAALAREHGADLHAAYVQTHGLSHPPGHAGHRRPARGRPPRRRGVPCE
ncbi:hypothetical protein BRC83_07400 [Halobacteriales archaeon QS_1_68_17]|nr:MAG: hypothetical protein BRC83_07400 [Halobacteriales archaeon QS_1_68_17]